MSQIADQLLKLGFKPTTIKVVRPEPLCSVFLFTEVGMITNGKANLIRSWEKKRRKVLNSLLVTKHTCADGVSLVGMPPIEASYLCR